MGILVIDPERHRNSKSKGFIYYLILVLIGIGLFVAAVGIPTVGKQLKIKEKREEVEALRQSVESYLANNDVDIYFTNDDLEYISDIEKVESQFENMVLLYDELTNIAARYSVTYAYMEFDTIENTVTFEIVVPDVDSLNYYLKDIIASQYFSGYDRDYQINSTDTDVNTKITVYYIETASRN